jgi:hypothetical protein
MPAPGQNEGFYVLEDFVCQAIPGPSISPAGPDKQGRNEGMFVTEELMFEAGKVETEPPARSFWMPRSSRRPIGWPRSSPRPQTPIPPRPGFRNCCSTN